ncbi:uncharacterized protein LOC117644249 [Thrips palmi]|uniref:Uncharacterized protein LOC117644249 n=1 Tax=Thrips palmi TaxID=161013 RepID=A0A6P8YQ62_THRPL|nr:uncharacterized protein LOC117644249 [Thrips palmi]
MENEEINRSDVAEVEESVELQDSSDDDLIPPGSKYPRQCECGQMYSTRQSYYKHQKSCTKEKKVSMYPRKCDGCALVLENKVQFCRHKKKCNGGGDTELRPKVVYPRECEKCHNQFSTKQEFSRHKKVECTAEGFTLKVAKHTQCLDPGCTLTFYHRTAMVDHLIKDHQKEFKIRQMSFKTMAEFTAWKDEVEAESWTCFRAPYGAKCNEEGTSKYRYFTCQFDAPERKDDKEKCKNKWKWEKGRIPTEVHCPARMLVTETEGQIGVKFIETHNHPLIFHHTVLHRVQLTTRHFIQSCLITGMAPAKILELLRGDVGELGNRDPNQRPKKEFFITLQYIKHCKSRIKAQGRLHKEDHISVDMHVRNLMHIGRFEVDGVKNDRYDGFDDGNFSPILVYKPQGKPVVVGHPNFDCIKNSAELFIVGFQTKEQLDVMKEGCKTVLCIDSTYSTNEYGFYLVNMVVQDPYGQGYPVAHFITNFQDEETLALAFESIKFRCPNLEVNLLMTDDDQAEYKAFLLIFPGTRHVLCTWHVRRNWKKNRAINRRQRVEETY